MKKQATSAALERLEAIAAQFLETEIANLETAQGVAVKEVEVAVVHDAPGESPVVDVTVST